MARKDVNGPTFDVPDPMIPARRRSLRFLLGVLLIIWGSMALTLPVGSMPNSRGRSDSTKGAVQLTFGPVGEQGPAVSPDGRLLAFEYFHPDEHKDPEIWVMPADGEFSSARALVANANRNADPTWSPDGKWISFMCEEEEKDHIVTDSMSARSMPRQERWCN